MNLDTSKLVDFSGVDAAGIEYELGVPIPGPILPQEQWVQTAIKRLPDSGPIEWSEVFGRSAPLVLDIGCGNGRFVISSAIRRPEVDHIGIDLLPVVIRYGTRRGNQRGLSNTRFAVCDGSNFLEKYVVAESMSEIHIYHPQPFHESEYHHQRLMTPVFLRMIHRSLKAGGQLFLQTDSRVYWDYIRTIVTPFFVWQDQMTSWPEDPHGRSRREFIAKDRKLQLFRAIATKRDELNEVALEKIVAELPIPDFVSQAPSKPSKRNNSRRAKPNRRR